MSRVWLSLAGLMLALPLVAIGQEQPVRADPHPGDAVFKRWDADGNGVLSQQEFRRGWDTLRQRAAVTRLRAQFERVDRNDDGAIDDQEYRGLLLVRRAGDQAPPLSRFDGNKDGRLQFDEYVSMVRQMGPVPAGTAGKDSPE